MTIERRDKQIVEALDNLRATTRVPPADPARERALLAAFDAHRARPRPAVQRSTWVGIAAAASLAIGIASGRLVMTEAPPLDTLATPDATTDLAGFVPWPGAYALPPLESGELRRIELPRAALPALGLSAPSSAASVVSADVVIGQDGLARAVRLVYQQ